MNVLPQRRSKLWSEQTLVGANLFLPGSANDYGMRLRNAGHLLNNKRK